MGEPEKHWMMLSRSRFPWEQEALDFIYERFPAQDNYRAWANFEFIADDGSITLPLRTRYVCGATTR